MIKTHTKEVKGRPTKNPESYYHRKKRERAKKEEHVYLHPFQSEAWLSEERFILLDSGTQGGKTFFGILWILNEINKDTRSDYLVCAPTYKMLLQSTLPRFLERARKYLPGKWNEQRKEYLLREGGRVFVRSADNPETLEAMTLKAAWLDEAGLMKKYVWFAMQSRLSVYKGRLLMTTSPYNLGWLYREVYKRKGEKDFEVIQFASNANPAFDKSEWERLKAILPESEFKRRFCGEFVKAEGLVYPDFDRERHTYNPETVSLPKELFKFVGMDVGYSSPTACAFCGVDKHGTVWVYDEYYERKGRLSYHADKIKGKGYSRATTIYCDKRAAQEIVEFSSLGLKITGHKVNDVNVGISKVSRLFKQNKIKVNINCRNLIDELETYSWKNNDDLDREVKKDEVIKKHDHIVDALRYGITSSSFMLPDMRREEAFKTIMPIYDDTTGMTIGFEEYRDNEHIDALFKTKGYKFADGTRIDPVTLRRWKDAV